MRSKVACLFGLCLVLATACGAEEGPLDPWGGAKAESMYPQDGRGREQVVEDHPLAAFAFEAFEQESHGEAHYSVQSTEQDAAVLCNKKGLCIPVLLEGVSVNQTGREPVPINAALWHSAIGNLNGVCNLPLFFRQANESERSVLTGYDRALVPINGRRVFARAGNNHLEDIERCRLHANRATPVDPSELDERANHFMCIEMTVLTSQGNKRFVYLLEIRNLYDAKPSGGVWLSPDATMAPVEFLYPVAETF